jgi:hypothetical protein
VAALDCLKYFQDGNTPTTDSPIPKLFPWALQCLPTLLDRAVITDALVQSARRHKFSQRSKDFLDDESVAKLGSSRLLSRTHRNFIRELVVSNFSPEMDQSIMKAVMDCGRSLSEGFGSTHFRSLLEPITKLKSAATDKTLRTRVTSTTSSERLRHY